ncbi:activating signal cointegrator 1 complex subunit 1 [Drosophila ficusphila]|uniref:activating signal cointegrator 1 complex subunit 1 n=1 Tax=Drosophila ficusphila TaxID=30025 RepID=UPI0007E864B6|nr:activating signal cointegrator 1 complex subunit 1 [Drosophila ficusphila]
MSREVVSPPVQKMSHNRRYRVNMVHEDFGGDKWNGQNKMAKRENKAYEEPDLYGEDDDEEDPAACNIEESPNGDFKLALHVPKSFYGGLIGLKGSTKRRIEEETRTEIYVPRHNEISNDILIRAKQRSHVCGALRQIRHIITSLRKRMKPTHFLAVALNSGEVKDRFVELKKSILEAQLPGIDEELFISERSIHLTLGVYVLLDDDERKKALDELEACRPLLADLNTPFDIKVKGLEIMNDDPSSTRVLYGRVESSGLQKFADQCLAHFQTTGLCATDNNQRESIKLHMTLMNNRYRKEAMKSGDSFDAREILKRFGDFDFGTAKCQAVHLCVLKSRGEDEFYKITGSLEF